MSMTIEEKMACVKRWHRRFETFLYVEMLRANRRTPALEFGPDLLSYHAVNSIDVWGNTLQKGRKLKKQAYSVIHIGIGGTRAEDEQELFQEVSFMIGHEIQHAKSTTEKDFKANIGLCMRDACTKLARDVLGKPSVRITSDADLDRFMEELRSNGVYISSKLLRRISHNISNILEDGRIEGIRCRNHPGFIKYWKLYRAKDWLSYDVREGGFPEDEKDLVPEEKVRLIMNDMLSLSTSSIHSNGFLSVYGNKDVYWQMRKLIPKIARAIMSRNTRGCMEQARDIFNLLLDDIIEACRTEAGASALQQSMDALQEALGESEDTQYSATPNNEEEGSGTPGESVFGQSDLEADLDADEYEKMKEEMEENGEDIADPSMNVQCGGGEEAQDGSDGSDAGNGEGSDGNDPGKSGSQAGDGSSEGDGSEDGQGEGAGGMPQDGSASNITDTLGGEKTPSLGHNNRDKSHNETKFDEDELKKKIQEEMAKAAEAIADDEEEAESCISIEEQFRKDAEDIQPVQPDNVDLSSLNDFYGDVDFLECVRGYKATLMLPFELENKGRSLNNKVEELIKNKRDPDERGRKSGSIDSTRLYVLIGGDITCHKRRGTLNKPDVAGFLLLDNSGSMGDGPGSTRYFCCDAASVIEEGFKNHMALKIAAFDARSTHNVTHEVIKEFDEVCPVNLSHNFKMLGRDGWGNKDGYSIRVATRQLLQRQEKDKILIVMSDGLPSDYAGGYEEGCKDVRAAVEEARKAGIKVVGIYMYHYQNKEDFAMYKMMYEPQYILAEMDEIEGELTRLLKKMFI